MLQPACEKSDIEINFSIDAEEDYFVLGDVKLLNQAVVNLLSNAIKFSKANSRIDIYIDEFNNGDDPDVVMIVIQDYGLGIPGSGLDIVSQIIQLHSGKIQIESVEGEGTTIIIELPKYLSPAEELVINRREAVLTRAIIDFEGASKQDLREVSHSLSGLIGFYTFEEEAMLIRDFTNWLSSGNLVDQIEVESRRQSILAILNLRLASLPRRDANE